MVSRSNGDPITLQNVAQLRTRRDSHILIEEQWHAEAAAM